MTNEELEKRLTPYEGAISVDRTDRAKCPFTEGPVGKKAKGSPWYDWVKDVQTACQLCGKPAVEKHYIKRSNANCYQWQCVGDVPHGPEGHKVELVVWDCVMDLGPYVDVVKTCGH